MASSLQFLELLIGYVVCIVVGLFSLVVIWKILRGDIDLNLLISEKAGDKTGGASMSRFQLLIFTFVVALSFFLVVVSNAKLLQTDANAKRSQGPVMPGLPEIPGGVLGLLGISASSYTVSKAIQANTPTKDDAAAPKA